MNNVRQLPQKRGYFAFVLHSHLPYVRKAGRWPHGEEMVHEALAETYVPLLNALLELKSEGIEPNLTIGLTPILLEQIADRSVLDHFEAYVQEEIEVSASDITRFEAKGQAQEAWLARFYNDWYVNILRTFNERLGRNVVAVFRRLQDDGNLDILTSAATHGYLPLLERDSSIYGQLKVGLETSIRHLGKAPRGIWLPECGYRPSYYEKRGQSPESAGYFKAGIEEFLASLNLHYFFTDTHVIEGGAPSGKVVGDAIGLYGAIPDRDSVIQPIEDDGSVERTTLRPYYVRQSRVAVLGRDSRTGQQVWSAKQGYPGDFSYREFHRKDATSGLQYWRVTGSEIDLADKDLYQPDIAAAKVKLHARHFTDLVASVIEERYAQGGVPGLIVSAYDTELFGHWWFEGVDWLKEVIRNLSNHPTVGLTTVDDYLGVYPPDTALNIPESSWGAGGNHWTWMNPETEWMWPLIHAAETRIEKLVERYPDAEGNTKVALNQLAREFLLLTSSDWPFLVSTGQAAGYAITRFQGHLARFNHLSLFLESNRLPPEGERFLTTILELDNPFPNIDYRVFANREGKLQPQLPLKAPNISLAAKE